jgi:lysophospholipase L1-like esterase
VRYIGRVDRTGTEARFEWSGTGIVWRFQGTEASIRLDDAAGFFSVLVDGVEQPRLATTPGEALYPIASGLSDGEHTIELQRRTEALFGTTRVLGVELGGGTLLPPPAPSDRRIEIIGDSITCGYGNEGADQYCSFSADTENHYLTYGAIAARNLGAELSAVAWSGKGVVYNYDTDTWEPMPELYARTLPNDTASVWDFSWQPHVVVIHLGNNDFSTDGDPPPATFTSAYEGLLADVRAKNPTAHIIAMMPTGLSGADLDAAQSGIDAAVQARNAAGDANVEAWSMTFASEGWGCDWHPSLQTHASMGAALTTKLSEAMGW